MDPFYKTVNLAASLLNGDHAELRRGLAAITEHAERPELRGAVFGPFNQGKSTLLNALLGSRSLPIDIVPTTGSAIVIRHGTNVESIIRLKDGRCLREPGTALLNKFAVLDQTRRLHCDVAYAEILCPHPLLENQITLVDLPGTNDQPELEELVQHELLTMDLVIQVLDARKLFTLEEQTKLKQWLLERGITNVLFVISFLNLLEAEDQQKVWRRALKRVEQMQLDSPPGSRLFRVDALPALRAQLNGDVQSLRSADLTAFCVALRKVIEQTAQHRQEYRLPRLNVLASKIHQALQDECASTRTRLNKLENRRLNKRAALVAKASDLRQRFAVSLNAFRVWLDHKHLLTACKSDLAGALRLNKFADWRDKTIKSHCERHQKSLHLIVKTITRLLKCSPPEALQIDLPPLAGMPTVSRPSAANQDGAIGESVTKGIAAGVALGWAFPGIGHLAGAIGGAIVGGIAGAFKKNNEEESYSRRLAQYELDVNAAYQSASRLRIEEKHFEVELSPGQSIQQDVRWFTSPQEASPDQCLEVQVTAAKLSFSVEDKNLVGTLIDSGEYYWNTLYNPRSSYEARLEGQLKASLAPELSDAAAEPFSFAGRWSADEMTFGEMQFQTTGERLTGEFSGQEEGTIQGVVDGRRADFTWMSKTRRGWGLIRGAGATRLLAGLWGSAEDKSDPRGMTAMAEEPATFSLPDVIVADRSRLRFLGYELLGAGKTEAAIAALDKALALCRDAETTGAYLDKKNCLVDELLILSHLVAAHFKLGDYQRWIDHLQRTLEIQRRLSPQANVEAIFDHSIARIKEAVVEHSGFIRQFSKNLAALHNELDVTPPAANPDVAATLPEEQKDRLDGKVIYLRAYLDSLLEMLNECESLMDVLKAKSDAWKITSVDALQSLELLSEDLRESLETGIWKIVSWVEETFKAHEDLLESAISLFRHFHPSPASAAQINYDAVVEAEKKTYALLDSTAEMSRIEKAFFFEALRLVPSLSTLAFQALCAKEDIAGRQLTAAVAEQAESTRAALRHLSDSLETWRSRLVTDIDKIEILTSGQPFFQELISLLIELGNYDEALVVSEKARARALADLMAARGNSPVGTDTTALDTDRIPSIASARPPDRETIQRITKEHKAFIVEYTILDSPSSTLCIWVVNPGGDINFRQYDLQHLFGDQITSLEDFIGKTRHDLGHGGYRLRNLTYQTNPPSVPSLTILYQILIHPIVDLLPGDDDTPVIFIPQGPLFQVPFAALQDLSGRYLIDKHPILIAPSIQILGWTRKRREKISASTNETALVVGNPKPAAASSKGSWLDPLMELPGAEREARRIAERLKTNALIGEQASKKQIIGMMADKRIIHFATHGLLDDAGDVDIPGAILLAGSDEDDGLLTSGEIMRLNLDSELVVLSACDTGRGRATGDGVIGLSRAFILAGVPSVVVSLWAIPDAPTALLMEEFYSNILRGANKAQALRRAMLAAKELHCDPFDWAAFTVIGEAE